MNRAVVVLFVAEIRPPRPLLVLGNMERVIDQFLYTLVSWPLKWGPRESPAVPPSC